MGYPWNPNRGSTIFSDFEWFGYSERRRVFLCNELCFLLKMTWEKRPSLESTQIPTDFTPDKFGIFSISGNLLDAEQV